MKKKIIAIIIISLTGIALIGALIIIHKKQTKTTNSGAIKGTVYLITGNCMPVVSGDSNCKKKTISRNVYIRKTAEKNNMNSTYLKNENKPKLIEKITSDIEGNFSLELEVGEYSVFVDDNGQEYCNSFDGQGRPCVIKIEKDKQNKYDIEINKAIW